MQKITKQIPFQRFHKSELRNLVKEVLAIVGSFALLTVFIKILLDRLTAVSEQLETMEVKQGKHPDTVELDKNRTRCLVLIKSIVSQVKVLKKANLESQVASLTLVDVLVRDYLKPVVLGDWSDRTFNLDKMFAELDSSDGLKDAIVALNLKMMFDELSGLVANQEVIKQSRSTSLMRRKKAITPEVRTEAVSALKLLFASIELAQIEHPEADFSEMVNGINQRLEYYAIQSKSRKTRNMKKPGDTTNQTTKPDSTTAA